MSYIDRIRAVEAAAETLDEHEVDQNHPIDPFALIEVLGLTLSITKLDNLLGAVVPSGSGGVLVTSERPPSVQRYTAAHEIGHWRLHRDYMMDTEDDIFSSPSSEIEHEAQVFASYLLMPDPLLHDAINRYGIRKGQVTPEQVYLLSRDLYVSYEAVARRLQTSHYLTSHDVIGLIKVGRLGALQRLFSGLRPTDGYADMWEVGLPEDDEQDVAPVIASERDEVVVILPEQRLSGWRWLTAEQLTARNARSTAGRRPRAPVTADATTPMPPNAPLAQVVTPVEKHPAELNAVLGLLPPQSSAVVNAASTVAEPNDDEPFDVVADMYSAELAPGIAARQLRRARQQRAANSHAALQADAQHVVGATGIRRIVLRCNEPGGWFVQLHYAHAYDPAIDPVSELRVEVNVQATPTHSFKIKLLGSDLNRRLPGDPDDDLSFEIDAP